MATHYIENASSGNQYYFNANNATTSQPQRTYASPVISSLGPSGYTTFSTTFSGSHSPTRLDDSYHSSQQYQSVAGFNRTANQLPQSPPPHLRATVRAVSSQDQYNLQRSPQPAHVSPQQHHFQFDSRQQAGHATGPAVVYQTPGAAQYTHHNVDLWTEGTSRGQDHLVQAQRVSVRSVSTGSPQQSHSISPQRQQDHLQQYYSQLTPEQHQQLLRQQQLQRQQEQQHHVTVQQISPPSTHHQEQYRATSGFGEGQPGRGRADSERQRQDEQDYHLAQRQMAAQRAQALQQEEPSHHPVGIRNLMNKFAGPATGSNHPRSKSTSSRQVSNYISNSGARQQTTTTTRTSSHSMTYSNLPKNREPPVNSAEYYQMQMLQGGGNPLTNIQLAAAPPHIQHASAGLGGLRDRYAAGSLSEDFYQPQPMYQQPQQRPQQRQQQQHHHQSNAGGGNTLLSLRNQYMNLASESTQQVLPTQEVQNISRTIIGEDTPQQKQQKQASAPQVPQQQQQQQPAPQASQQEQPQNQNTDQGASSSETAPPPPPPNDTTTAAAPTPSK